MALVVARRLFEIAGEERSGTLQLEAAGSATPPPAPIFAELTRGWIYAIHLSPAYSLIGAAPARGEERLRKLLELAREHYHQPTFRADARATKWGACAPFHPGQVLRNYIDGVLRDAGEALGQEQWRLRVGDARVRLARPPHNSSIGHDERALAAFLARPRSVAELEGAGLLPRERASRLLAFLDAVGALAFDYSGVVSPYSVLELAEGASLEEVRRAYRRLALALHPDRHAGADAAEQQRLRQRFEAVALAYQRLT